MVCVCPVNEINLWLTPPPEFINSVEDLLQFLFEVIAAAVCSFQLCLFKTLNGLQNELLLDRLVLICAAVILTHSSIQNACFVLADATYYHVPSLIEKLQEYVSVNMETFLESRMLDDIPYTLVKQLAKFIKARQTEKTPFSRSGVIVDSMLQKHAGWLAQQDLPETIVRSATKMPLRRDGSTAKLSPELSGKKLANKVSFTEPLKLVQNTTTSPRRILRRPPSGDEIFLMDEPESPTARAHPEESVLLQPSLTAQPVWKAQGTPK